MIGLSENGKRDLAWVLAVLALLAVVYLGGRKGGANAAKTAADEAAEVAFKARLDTAVAAADSLKAFSDALLVRVAEAEKPRRVAVARTDSGVAVAESARHEVERVLADRNAELEDVRKAAAALALADSIAFARFAAERAASLAKLAVDSAAMAAMTATIAAKDNALARAAEDRAAQVKVIADLKGERRGLFRRALNGVLTVGAAAGCGAVGALIGPAAAVGGAVGCGAAVAAFAP